MQVSTHAQAVLLLTSHLAKTDQAGPKPLSTHEWAKFAYWMDDQGLQPAELLDDDRKHLLSEWRDRGISQDRIEHLLRRGGALGLALERWQRAGLWVITRSDSEYPQLLRKRLKFQAPPVLFGCGSNSLLNRSGIAVVGSRNASAEDLAFAARLGAEAASQGFSVVSGGARGIDESAMLGALESEGTAVGVLADGLLRLATSAKYRKHLMSNDLALVSPFNPEAGFNVGNAMARNRYIYCLAVGGIVVAASRENGGTWNGAIENLKSSWVPLWVKSDSDPNSGNAELVRRGASWLPRESSDLSLLLATKDGEPAVTDSREALPVGSAPQVPATSNSSAHSGAVPEAEKAGAPVPGAIARTEAPLTPDPAPSDALYEVFLNQMKSLTAETPRDVDNLQRHLNVLRSQLNVWLKRALAEGRVKKLKKPVKYRWQGGGATQIPLFD